MPRISRKTAILKTETISVIPRRIYHAAAYIRLSAEEYKRSDNEESIIMQQYMLERYIAEQSDMVLCGVYSDSGKSGTDFAGVK